MLCERPDATTCRFRICFGQQFVLGSKIFVLIVCYKMDDNQTKIESNTDSNIDQAKASSTLDSQQERLDVEGKNRDFIRCTFCSCLILRPSIAALTEKSEINLPKIERAKVEESSCRKFWLVQDIYQFENLSFSRTVDDMKYLACAECDIGPIGYQDQSDKTSYIAFERVSYTEK